MSRRATEDFRLLQTFLGEYRIHRLDLDDEFSDDLRGVHRRCLAALQMWAEIEAASMSGAVIIGGHGVSHGDSNYVQLAESFSDLTGSFAAVIHGLTKPALMMVRSSVETFVRGLVATEDPSALKITSMYQLLDRAKTSAVFSGAAAPYFSDLRQTYKLLCLVTHSSPNHLTDLRSLSAHFGCEVDDLARFNKHFTKVVKAISGVLIFAAPWAYLDAKPAVRDLLDEVVPKEARLSALGG